MPWKETCTVDERLKFVGDLLKFGCMSELCLEYGISRPTGYKWLSRYKALGPTGLLDRSRAPKGHPNMVSADLEAKILTFKAKHPFWGPKKIAWRLTEDSPEIKWPAPSTIGDLLKRKGMVRKRRPRRHQLTLFEGSMNEGAKPNDVWAADFKGWFRTQDGCRVDPLTISDLASRYLLRCQGMRRTYVEPVKSIFLGAFREYGLPTAIRTDNGPPFSGLGPGGLTKLSIWWIRLGIMPERIRPGQPQDNGVHERMHRSLKEGTAKPSKANFIDQQRAFDSWCEEFNELRPHEGIEMQPPARLYSPSAKSFPKRLPEVEYGPDYTVRTVKHGGELKWKGRRFYIGESLEHERVGLLRVDDNSWQINFGPIRLGLFDIRKMGFRRA